MTPHPEKVVGAQVCHLEGKGRGHVPPVRCEDIASRAGLLLEIGCMWWTLELHDPAGLLETRDIVSRCLADISNSDPVQAPVLKAS
ncbi:MAG: hypothetical protein ACQET7_05885 [Thermodesulfobacteriota bacterium]